jgi:hypothetical protein
MVKKMSEQDIQKAILDLFNLYGVAVKTGSGGFKVDERFVKMTSGFNGGKGWVDIVWICKGKILLCEVKTPKGVLSESQRIMHEAIRKQGIKVHVLRSLDDAVALLQEVVDPVKVETRI